MAGNFSATVDAWVAESKERLLAVFHEAAQRVVIQMQTVGPSVKNPGGGGGHMPVDTGYLRSSLVATVNAPETQVTFKASDLHAATWDGGAVSAIILGAKIGETIYAVYTASYARRMEYGFSGTDSLGRQYNQQGYGFVRLAAQSWQEIVDKVVSELKQ